MRRREFLRLSTAAIATAAGLTGCDLKDLFPPSPTTSLGYLFEFIQDKGVDATITEEQIKKADGISRPCQRLVAANRFRRAVDHMPQGPQLLRCRMEGGVVVVGIA